MSGEKCELFLSEGRKTAFVGSLFSRKEEKTRVVFVYKENVSVEGRMR